MRRAENSFVGARPGIFFIHHRQMRAVIANPCSNRLNGVPKMISVLLSGGIVRIDQALP